MAGHDLIDWANTAPRADLAAELMAAFGGERACRIGLRCEEIEGWLLGRSIILSPKVKGPILEALQLLEHSELIYYRSWDRQHSHPYWRATQLGLATPASRKDVVRQRIKERIGL
jgi:hypothetical protein